MTTREAMIYVADMAAHAPKPDCYRWIAKWWRLHGRESANPSECLRFANGQMALYRDMTKRPEHYTDTLRPSGATDWQWSGLGHNAEITGRTLAQNEADAA